MSCIFDIAVTSDANQKIFLAPSNFFLQIYLYVNTNIMVHWYTSEILYHLFIKYLCEQNVINNNIPRLSPFTNEG